MSKPITREDVLFQQRLLRLAGYTEVEIDGELGPVTIEAQRRWDVRYRELCTYRLDGPTETAIHSLIPKVQALARQFIERLSMSRARIASGTRTYAEQDALYQIGRGWKPGATVTNARGGESRHNFGIAFDIALFDEQGRYIDKDIEPYKAAALYTADIRAAGGLAWGGDWKGDFQDWPHYELALPLSTRELRERFEAGTLVA